MLLEGVADRCLCRPYRDGLFGASARTHPLPSIPPKRPRRLGHWKPQSTASQQLPAPPHCFLYETAEGSACGTTRAERLGPKIQKSRCKTKGRPPSCVTKPRGPRLARVKLIQGFNGSQKRTLAPAFSIAPTEHICMSRRRRVHANGIHTLGVQARNSTDKPKRAPGDPKFDGM